MSLIGIRIKSRSDMFFFLLCIGKMPPPGIEYLALTGSWQRTGCFGRPVSCDMTNFDSYKKMEKEVDQNMGFLKAAMDLTELTRQNSRKNEINMEDMAQRRCPKFEEDLLSRGWEVAVKNDAKRIPATYAMALKSKNAMIQRIEKVKEVLPRNMANSIMDRPPTRTFQQTTFQDLIELIHSIQKRDFRKMTGPSLTQMSGHLKMISLDSHACQYLKFRLFKEPDEMVYKAFVELEPEIKFLATHKQGNYLIKSLLQVLDHGQLKRLIDILDVPNIIDDRFGNGVVQTAMRLLPRFLKKVLFQHLKGLIVDLSKLTYASYTLELCAEILPPFMMYFVPEEVESKTMNMAKHITANRVLQKIIICFPEFQVSGILEILYTNIQELLLHDFGTWVVQAMMAKNRKNRDKVVEIVTENFFELVDSEPGKRALKKALNAASIGQRKKMIQKVIDSGAIGWLYLYPYGREIVDTMIKKADSITQRRYLDSNLDRQLMRRDGTYTALREFYRD